MADGEKLPQDESPAEGQPPTNKDGDGQHSASKSVTSGTDATPPIKHTQQLTSAAAPQAPQNITKPLESIDPTPLGETQSIRATPPEQPSAPTKLLTSLKEGATSAVNATPKIDKTASLIEKPVREDDKLVGAAEKPVGGAEKPPRLVINDKSSEAGERKLPQTPPAVAALPPLPAVKAEGPPKAPVRAVVRMTSVEITGDRLIDSIKAKFGDGIVSALEVHGQQTLVVKAAQVHDLLLYLRDEAEPNFNMLTDVTAVHWKDREPAFEIVYHAYALTHCRRLRVKTEIGNDEQLPSASDIWGAANWMEREVYDLFGIKFGEHPDLRRILLPQGWVGHPLRKDYPLEYRDNEWVAQNLKIRDLPLDNDYTGKFE